LGEWLAVGPFKAESAEAAFSTDFGPEKHFDPAATYLDGTLRWSRRSDWSDAVVHNLTGGDNCAWYMTRTMSVLKAQDVVLWLGSDDGFQLWFDGVPALVKNVYRSVAPDEDSVTIHVPVGEHRLLLKVNNGGGGYGFFFRMAGVSGQNFPRGGVMGMGVILMQTAQATRTSPVRRGVWFLENMLGTKPPPPPPKAKEELIHVEAAATAQMSRRQILERHRSNTTCATCHARFDPYGFAMENFGPDGQWRTNELIAEEVKGSFHGVIPGPPIDASGVLPDGRTFEDIIGLKRQLVAEPHLFVHAFATKLLALAIGRRLGPQDDASVEAIVNQAIAHDYHIHAVLKAVVASDSFQFH
jgi:hypothetical protein